MQVHSIKTHRITNRDRDLYAILDRYLTSCDEGSILVVTSKIVSICQKRMVRVEEADKQALIESEADYWLAPSASKYHVSLTIVDHLSSLWPASTSQTGTDTMSCGHAIPNGWLTRCGRT